MRILFVTSEVTPFSKTGGLADVSQALPQALAGRGHQVTVVTPRYRGVDRAGFILQRIKGRIAVPVHGRNVPGYLFETMIDKVRVVFVDQADYFDRPGLYGEGGGDYPDNAERFAFFCRAALAACATLDFRPQVVHLNDWQTGPAAVLLQSQYRDLPQLNASGTVITIHNLAYAGSFPPQAMLALGLNWDFFTPSGLEFYGKVSYLKAGLVFADKITTVSRVYAREIQTPAFGCGFEGLLKERSADVHGILNGVDYRNWDPGHDSHIAAAYSAEDFSGKRVCKADLQRTLGLEENPDIPIVGVVSRLSYQKGFDQMLPLADRLLGLKAQWAVLGVGEQQVEEGLAEMARRAPGRFAFRRQLDEVLAHKIQAGSDILLMPSRYEPCGLNQLYALRYGTIPVVRAVGGLEETVEDIADNEGYGFKFSGEDPEQLLKALQRALSAFADKQLWTQLMQRAMELDFSWERPARQYELLYRQVAALRSEK